MRGVVHYSGKITEERATILNVPTLEEAARGMSGAPGLPTAASVGALGVLALLAPKRGRRPR